MPGDIELGITLTADGSDLVGAVRVSRGELDRLEDEFDDTGKAADKASKKTGGFARAASMAAKGIGLAATAAAAAAAGLVAYSAVTLANADAVGKQADKIGVGVEALQEYRYAAELSGVAQNTLDMAVQRFSRRLGEARQGTGELLPVLKQYGIALTDAEGRARSVEAVMADYSDAVAGAGDASEQLRLAFKGFDSEGAALVNMLRQGSDGLERMRGEARELNFVLSRMDVAKAAAAQDAMTRLGKALSGVGNKIAIAAAPYLKLFADLLVDGIKKSGWLTRTIGWFAENTIHGLAAVANAWVNLGKIWQTIKWGFGELISVSLEGLAKLEDAVLAASEWLPGLEPPETGPLRSWANEWEQVMQGVRRETLDTLRMPLPGDELVSRFNEINRQIDEAVAAAAANRPAGLSVITPPSDEEIETTVSRATTTFDLVRIAHAANQKAMTAISETEARAREEIRAQHLATLEGQVEQHLARINQKEAYAAEMNRQIWESGMKGKLQITQGILGQLAGLMESRSKKMFQIAKAAAIGETIISTLVSAQRSYEAFSWFPPLGAAMAAISLAAGFARVQAIKSQTFGGGGASAGGGRGSASAPSVDPEQGRRSVSAPKVEPDAGDNRKGIAVFNVESDSGMVSLDWFVNKLGPVVEEAVRDGYTPQFAGAV